MLTAKESGLTRRARGFLKNNKPAKDLGEPLHVFAVTVLFFIVSQFVAAFIVELALALVYQGRVQNLFNQSIVAQFFFVLLAEGLAFWLVYWLVKRRRIGFGFIGLGRRPKPSDFGRAAIGYGAFLVLTIAASALLTLFLPNFNVNQNQNVGFNNLHGFGGSLLAFIALVILPPLGEEPLVRGYLYSGLRKHWRFVSAMLATSVFFGLAHLEIGNGTPLVWGAAIETFILSVVLCYLREKTGALYAGIMVHMLNNLLAFIVHFHG